MLNIVPPRKENKTSSNIS